MAVLTPAYSESGKTVEYHDPQDRFSLQAPKGWKVQPLGDSVQIVRENSYVSVVVLEHSTDAKETIQSLSQSIGKQWKNFQSAGESATTLSGQSAVLATFSGTNPQKLEAVLQLQCVVSGGTAYVLLISAPKGQFPQPALTDIVHSFTLEKGTAAASAQKPAMKPTLGLELTDLSQDDAGSYGLKEASGALVIGVRENGPAQKAGVKLHDLIVAADGKTVDSAATMDQTITSHKPGDAISLDLVRVGEGGKPQRETIRVEVGGENGKP